MIKKGVLTTPLLLLASPAYHANAIELQPGIELDVSIVFDYSNITNGGIKETSSTRSLIDAGLSFDMAELFGLHGASILISGEALRGDDAGVDAGVIQAFSNIDEAPFSRFFEVWYQQQVGDKVILKLGQQDANSDFATSEHADAFMHSSMGFSPTILSMPTYPEPVLAGSVMIRINDQWAVQTGAFDASGEDDFDEIIVLGEVNWSYREQGRLKLGYWQDSTQVDDFNGNRRSSTGSWYLVLDETLWRDRNSSLGFFTQVGSADDDWGELTRHLGAGLTYYSPMDRPDDSTGIGFSSVDLNKNVTASGKDERETAIEIFYQRQINENLSVRPDIQYIKEPGGDSTIDDVLVLSVRIELAI